MTDFNASFGITNFRTPLGSPSFKGDSTMQSSYLDDISFILACLEGSFPYNSGMLPNNTGFQSEGGVVSTFPSR